jgi:2-keto-4-pentenoate hydratase/2-oxohepta-3-ene-1,7-dioic acid hydratase in catechol pathway
MGPDGPADDGLTTMKLATFSQAGGPPRLGAVVGDTLIPLDSLAADMSDLIARWAELKPRAEQMAASVGLPLADVKLHAPIARPGKILAIGLNYADHIAESGVETPANQVWFCKHVTAVNGPFDPIEVPTPFCDYEVELVAVVGAGGRRIGRDDAPAAVFGWCVGNDMTERMWQHRTPQWMLGKSFDTHAPFGPWIVTADEVADPHALDLTCDVNGERRQSSNTRNLVFDVWEQIEHLSFAMTLEPGDLIFTGTPGGVGAAMNPRQFLKAGDVVRCEIESLGAIEATCVS